MISKNMEKALNHQIELEGYASQYYLAMGAWCDRQGLEGAAAFMHQQSLEERAHMMKLFHYLSEVDGYAITPALAQPPLEFSSIQEVLELMYQQEQKVTQSINDLLEICYKENDYNTLNFLQWYVEEQREEENLARTILDKVKLIGDGGQSLYFIDRELSNIMMANAKKAQNADTGAA